MNVVTAGVQDGRFDASRGAAVAVAKRVKRHEVEMCHERPDDNILGFELA